MICACGPAKELQMTSLFDDAIQALHVCTPHVGHSRCQAKAPPPCQTGLCAIAEPYFCKLALLAAVFSYAAPKNLIEAPFKQSHLGGQNWPGGKRTHGADLGRATTPAGPWRKGALRELWEGARARNRGNSECEQMRSREVEEGLEVAEVAEVAEREGSPWGWRAFDNLGSAASSHSKETDRSEDGVMAPEEYHSLHEVTNSVHGVYSILCNRWTMLELRGQLEQEPGSSHRGGADALRAKLQFVEDRVYQAADGVVADEVLQQWLNDFDRSRRKAMLSTTAKSAATVDARSGKDYERLRWRRGPPPPSDHGVSLKDATPQQQKWLDVEKERLLANVLPEEQETLKKLRRLAKPNDWCFSFDLQHGFHALGIHRDFQRFMRFDLQGELFQCSAVPFGWSGAPRVFCKLRNEKKGQWDPVQVIKHLCLEVDLKQSQFRVTEHRVHKIHVKAKQFLCDAARNRQWLPARRLASFTGLCQSVYLAVPAARLYLRELYFVLTDKRSCGAKVKISRAAWTDLEWWSRLPVMSKWNRRKIWRLPTRAQLHTDSSMKAWIELQTHYICSEANVWADNLSRCEDLDDWRLNRRWFEWASEQWGPSPVDRFASEISAQLPCYYAAWRDPLCEGVDSLAYDGRGENNWVNPPWALLDEVAHKLRAEGAAATVVAPYWPAQSWFRELEALVTEALKVGRCNVSHRGLPVSYYTAEVHKSSSACTTANKVTVSTRIKVCWKDDDQFYPGVVKEFNDDGKAHVMYDDGDEETLDLSEKNLNILCSSGVMELNGETSRLDN
eukprot:gene9400-biopygen9588